MNIMSRLLLIICCCSAAPSAEIIVDWGHDWGNGWYRQSPKQTQNSKGWKSLVQLDLNNNGTTDDDHTAGWEYSDTIPLSPSNIIYDYTYPSAKFYGAAIVQITDVPKKEDGKGYVRLSAPSEGHINQNHELRDDWNLMSFPVVKRKPELSRYAGAMLVYWKKEDFLNGGAERSVSFDKDSYIGVFVSRYWGGLNWGRWVIKQNGAFYISKDTFANQTKQYDLTEHSPNGGKGGNPITKHTHCMNPADTLWAPYNPKAPHDVFFNEAAANYKQFAFNDVEAVGFLIQRNMSTGHPVAQGLWKLPHGIGEPIALKFNAVQVRAKLSDTPKQSGNVDMVTVQNDKESLDVGRTEINYQEWVQVFRWAVTNQRARNLYEKYKHLELAGYSFAMDGTPGNALHLKDRSYSLQEPVTQISIFDAITWCNALSELEGREAAYYEDAAFTKPYRITFDRSKIKNRNQYRPVHWKQGASGYRLPTQAEFIWLAGNNDMTENNAWTMKNSAGQTHPVGSKEANIFGLHDVYGNVAEYVWTSDTNTLSLENTGSIQAMGGSFLFPNEKDETSCAHIGFRVVRGPQLKVQQSATTFPICKVSSLTPQAAQLSVTKDDLVKRVNELLSMVQVEKAGGLPTNNNFKRNYKETGQYDLNMAKTETPYLLWSLVKQWATTSGGYTFNHEGDMGSLHYTTPEALALKHSIMEPVTNISWRDAIVWCNALSELMGKEPVYYDDKSGEVMKDASIMRVSTYLEYHYPNLGRYAKREIDTAAVLNLKVDTDKNGYRLPSHAELMAVTEKSTDENHGWFLTNAKGSTQNVGKKSANAFGLHDLHGNVQEMTYGGNGLFGQIRFGNSFAEMPGVYTHSMARMELTSVGRSYVGFRVVSR